MVCLNNSSQKVSKRAQIISITILLCYLISIFGMLINIDVDTINNLFLLVNILFSLWVYIDFEVFRDKKLYKKSIVIAFIRFLLNCVIFITIIKSKNYTPIFLGHSTLIMLLAQTIFRNIYIKLFNKEPRIVGSAGSIPEMFYSFILMLVLFLLTPFLSKYFSSLLMSFL